MKTAVIPAKPARICAFDMTHSRLSRFLILVAWFVSASAAGATGALIPQSIAPGVYMVPGASEEPAPANAGRVSNLGIIAGSDGAIVIGTGTSAADGEALLAAAERLAGKPVVLAIDAYAAPDHVLGNSAFTRRGIPVMAHEETERFLDANCRKCIDRLTGALGPGALTGTEFSRPTRIIDAGATITAGGRTLDILYYGPAHQRGDLAVYDRESGVLFAGALASFDQVPDLQNADLDGWLKALQAMERLGARLVVPANGPVAPPQRLSDTADYLRALRAAVQRAYDGGASMLEAPGKTDLAQYRSWALYETQHRKNVHFVYLQIENGDIAR